MKILGMAHILIILLKIYIYFKLRVDNKSFRRSIFLASYRKISHTIYQNLKSFIRLFGPNDKLWDKFHHAPDLDSPIPGTLDDAELARLVDPSLYREKL
jgi:hypothetical protein